MDDSHILARRQNWLLASHPRSAHGNSDLLNYFVVWMEEEPPSKELIATLSKMCEIKNLLPGMKLELHAQPSLGIVISTKPKWRIHSEASAARLLEKLIWEQHRIMEGS